MPVATHGHHVDRSLPGAAVPERQAEATAFVAPRLHYLDWLRVFAIAGVFLYHSLRPFDAADWHVKNAETSDALGALMGLFWSFGLAVLFLVSGAGARFALRRRTWRTFLRERTTRLLVPFVAGTLLLSPLQAYLEATSKGLFAGSLLAYVGVWASRLVDRLGSPLTPTIVGIGYHLWFLGFLFVISVVTLPLLEWLTGRRGRDAVDALARAVSRRPGASLAFAIPIGLLMTTGVLLGTAEHDWFELLWYLGYFVIGFLFVADDRFMAAVRRDGRLALVVAALGSVVLLATPAADLLTTMAGGLDVPHLLVGYLFTLEGWCWTLVVLNLGLRVARLQRPVGRRVGDAVLPVYVLHQPVILAVAFFVVQWPLGILTKWIAVLGVSLAITIILVELGSMLPVARFLLGGRGRGPAPVKAEAPSLDTATRPAGSLRDGHHASPG